MNKRILFRNAIANVVRGSAAMLVAVLVPPFLIRILPREIFNSWILILQLAAYTSYLDFGIQTAVGRFVAHANELGDISQRDRIISTSISILTGAAGLGLLLTGLLAWQLPNLFGEMPSALHANARLSLLLVGGSLAIGLPFSVFNGIFIGLQRYEIPATIVGGGKLLGAVFVIIAASIGGGLVLMGATLALVNIGSYVAQLLVSRRFAKDVQIKQNLISKQAGYEIFSYCFSLTIWSFAMLLVNGLDTVIVGFFDFEAVAYYAVAANLIIFISGIQTALFSVLMPTAAVLSARADEEGLGRLLITSTRYSMFVLLLTGLPLVAFAHEILNIWVGNNYASKATILLQLLVIANIVRLSATPYITLLIGTGQQRLIIISPLIEGFSNLLVSIIAGSLFGSIGVAIGTLVGGVVGILSHFLYNMRRSTAISIRLNDYLVNGLLRPITCIVPLLVAGLIINQQSAFVVTVIITIAVASSLLLIWNYGLLMAERKNAIFYMLYPIRFFSKLNERQST